MIYEKFTYTPFTSCVGGTAYYNLQIGEDVLQFKEHSYRDITARKQHNFARHYRVPKQYENDLTASFLVLEYPSNHNESGAADTYVITKK